MLPCSSLHAMLACFALLPAATAAFGISRAPPVSFARVRASVPLMVDEARQKLIKGGLPTKFAERVSFQSSGQRIAGQEDEILILWKEFKKCYRSEAVAVSMLSKNTAVILPQLNSPRKIKGTFAQLKKRFGKAGAAEIIEKNPGVLVCSPEGLLKQSDKDILDAAELVATLEDNKPIINAIAGVLLLAIVASLVYRIGTVNGGDASTLITNNPYFR